MAEVRGSNRRTRRGGFLLLPEELVDEILIGLPVKSITRFESVCKRWLSKFRSTSFVDLHNNNNNKPESIVHTINQKDLYKMAPELSMVGPWREISMIGPLKNTSIYCIISAKYQPTGSVIHINDDLLSIKIALCNPGIHHFHFLPPLPPKFPTRIYSSNNNCIYRVNLTCGFGTVSSSDYKVVVIINYGHGSLLPSNSLVFVYSLHRQKWEEIVIPAEQRDIILNLRPHPPMEACSQRFVKGCWHWRTLPQLDIVSFNFATGSFKLIRGPPSQYVVTNVDDVADVVVLHDHLVVILAYTYKAWVKFDIWMMMEYGVEESWTSIYSIRSDYVVGASSLRLLLYRIDYSEEGSNGIHVERLFFTGLVGRRTLTSFDEHGKHQNSSFSYDWNDLYLNTGGISTYRETLQRLPTVV